MDEDTLNSIVKGLGEAIVIAGLSAGKEKAQSFIDNLRQTALLYEPPTQHVMFIIAGRAQERLDAWNRATEHEYQNH